MTNLELILNMLAEASTTELVKLKILIDLKKVVMLLNVVGILQAILEENLKMQQVIKL